MRPYGCHLLFLTCLKSVVAQGVILPTITQLAATISPVCLEPRATSDPSALDIVTALNDTNAVADACNNTLKQSHNDGTFSTVYYSEGEFFFNVTHRDGEYNLLQEPESYCINNFQGIINACITQQLFWGGWVDIVGANWSVSNYMYPQNPVPMLLSIESQLASATQTHSTTLVGSGETKTKTIVSSSGASTSISATCTGTSIGNSATTSFSSSTNRQIAPTSTLSAIVNTQPRSFSLSVGSSSSSGVTTLTTGSGATPGSIQSTLASSTIALLSVYTISGIPLTGNPTSLVAGTFTLVPGGSALTSSGHTIAIPASATGGQIQVDGIPAPLPTPSIIANTGTATGIGTASIRAPLSTYTIDGIIFTGNPTSLALGSTTLTPGGLPLTMSGHTIAIPATATGGFVIVDGSLTALPIPVASSSSQSATVGQTTGPQIITPAFSITGAFAAGLSTTTITDGGGGVLIYTMNTFSNLATITGAPILIHTTVIETLSDGSLTTFIGGINVGSGGRWWGPPGLPKIEIGPGGGPIKPECIWPFCPPHVDDDGSGGGDPGGVAPPAVDPPADPDPNDPEKKTQPDDDPTKTQNKSDQEPSATSLQTITSAASTRGTTTVQSCTMSSVVSDCNVVCNMKRLRVRQAHTTASQQCSTTCYSTLTGCTITGTTATITTSETSTATAVQQIILPDETADIDVVNSIMVYLNSTFDADMIFAFIPENQTIASDSMFVIPWDIETQPSLTKDQIAKIAAQPGVASVVANEAYTSTGAETATMAPPAGSDAPDASSFTLPESAAQQTFGATVSGPRRKAKRTAAPEARAISDQNNTLEGILQKRDGNYLRQVDPAAWQLKAVSQPLDAATAEFLPRLDYLYDTNQGGDTYNYNVGTGVRMDHEEFEDDATISNNWLWGPAYPRARQQRVDVSPYGHETCTASIITGTRSGVSKGVTIYPVQILNDLANFLWVFTAITDDITRRRRRGRFPSGWITIYFGQYADQSYMSRHEADFARIRRRMQRLLDDDILIIVTAGNFANPGREDVDMFPSVWESAAFPVIVAGSSNQNGVKAAYSQAGPHVDVWAPGVDTRCGGNANIDNYLFATGDCFAAAVVTGLTNYWLSFRRPPFRTSGGLANRIKTFYRTNQANDGGSYIRTGGDVQVVWNLVDGYYYNRPQPCEPANNNEKRDDSPACTPTSASTGTVTVTTMTSCASCSTATSYATLSLPTSGVVTTNSGTTATTSSGGPTLTSTVTSPPSSSSTRPSTTTPSSTSASITAPTPTSTLRPPTTTTTSLLVGGAGTATLPVSTLPAIASNCNCNEDGCTPNSPACCANGSCPSSLPAPAAAAKTYTCAYVTSVGSFPSAATTITQTSTCLPSTTDLAWLYECGRSTYVSEKVYYASCSCSFVGGGKDALYTRFTYMLNKVGIHCPATPATSTATLLTLQTPSPKNKRWLGVKTA